MVKKNLSPNPIIGEEAFGIEKLVFDLTILYWTKLQLTLCFPFLRSSDCILCNIIMNTKQV